MGMGWTLLTSRQQSTMDKNYKGMDSNNDTKGKPTKNKTEEDVTGEENFTQK